MNTGALQQFVYLHGKCPFERPVVIGSELVAFSTLLTLRHAGLKPLAIIEENARITARAPGKWIARLGFGVPVLTNTRLLRIIGRDRVTGIEIDRGFGPEQMDVRRRDPDRPLPARNGLDRTLSYRDRSRHPWSCHRRLFPLLRSALFRGRQRAARIETAGQCWRRARRSPRW